jgi:hypothetical protein
LGAYIRIINSIKHSTSKEANILPLMMNFSTIIQSENSLALSQEFAIDKEHWQGQGCPVVEKVTNIQVA